MGFDNYHKKLCLLYPHLLCHILWGLRTGHRIGTSGRRNLVSLFPVRIVLPLQLVWTLPHPLYDRVLRSRSADLDGHVRELGFTLIFNEFVIPATFDGCFLLFKLKNQWPVWVLKSLSCFGFKQRSWSNHFGAGWLASYQLEMIQNQLELSFLAWTPWTSIDAHLHYSILSD